MSPRPGDTLETPIRHVHDTEEGSIYLLVLPSEEGGWKALLFGALRLESYPLPTVKAANNFICDRFANLFPQHRCTQECKRRTDLIPPLDKREP
jgi:hypothetical protein